MKKTKIVKSKLKGNFYITLESDGNSEDCIFNVYPVAFGDVILYSLIAKKMSEEDAKTVFADACNTNVSVELNASPYMPNAHTLRVCNYTLCVREAYKRGTFRFSSVYYGNDIIVPDTAYFGRLTYPGADLRKIFPDGLAISTTRVATRKP